MPSILDKIVAKKREELAASKWTVSMESLREAIADRPPAWISPAHCAGWDQFDRRG